MAAGPDREVPGPRSGDVAQDHADEQGEAADLARGYAVGRRVQAVEMRVGSLRRLRLGECERDLPRPDGLDASFSEERLGEEPGGRRAQQVEDRRGALQLRTEGARTEDRQIRGREALPQRMVDRS